MKKILATTLAFAMLATMFSGCQPQAAAPAAAPAPASQAPAAAPASEQAAAPASQAPAPVDAGKPIKIGMVNPMTGNSATFGQSHFNGMKLVIDDINAAGGINGRKIEISTYDDAGNPQQAASGAQKYADQEDCVAIAGSCLSSSTLAIVPIIDKAKLPELVVSSSSPKLTGSSPYFFRMSVQDSKVGIEMADTIYNTLKAQTCAILYPNNDYGKGLEESTRQELEKYGVKIVESLNYLEKDQDYQAPLTKIKNLNPDCIAFCGTYTDGALIAKQARQIGLETQFVGGTGPNSPKFVEIAGEAAEGFIFLGCFVPTNPDSKVQEFVTKYKEKFGIEPDNFAGLAYDQMLTLADAFTRAAKDNDGKVDRATVAEALKTSNVQGITGTVTFDSNNDWVRPYLKLTIKDGKFVVYTPPAN